MSLIKTRSFVNSENHTPIPVKELALMESGNETTEIQLNSAFESVTTRLISNRIELDIVLTRDQLIAIKDYITNHLESWPI